MNIKKDLGTKLLKEIRKLTLTEQTQQFNQASNTKF